MADVKIIREEPRIIKPEEAVKRAQDGGMSGQCDWVLKDAKTGAIKQTGTSKNMITARGLDYIISHIVSGLFSGPTLGTYITEGQSSTYHGKYNSSDYVTGSADTNPFKYLILLYAPNASSTQAAAFDEGRAVPGSNSYLHKCTNPTASPWTSPVSDGIAGTDVQSYDTVLADAGAQSGTSHNFSAVDPTTRPKILGWKALSDRNSAQSIQSNEYSDLLHFQKCAIVFNFTTAEGNAATNEGINSIAWANNSDCQLVGARLTIGTPIPKTSADTLDITYTFDLSVS